MENNSKEFVSFPCKPIKNYYLISEENAVFFVVLGRIDPRIADEVEAAMTGNSFEGQCLKVELIVVKISNKKRTGNSYFIVPLENDIEG